MSAVPIFAKISANGGCADVVFVHGLTGDPKETWSSKGTSEPEGEYWPHWLSADLPHLNYYTLGYPASIFAQWAKKEMNLFDRAKNALETLTVYGFGSRPIVFICHSLGGLLVKQILRTANDSSDDDWKRVAKSCEGIFFLATPHSGSSLADLLKMFSGCFASIHVSKLQKDSSDLDELNASFRSLCLSQAIQISVYHEMHKTAKIALVVDPKSADPGVNAVMPVAIDADHLSICKPVDRFDIVYASIRHRLQKIAPFPVSTSETAALFDDDGLDEVSEHDRRDLLTKMITAGREDEYAFANDSQNRFARNFVQSGLKTATNEHHLNLLSDIEQRFNTLIYHPLICTGADLATISMAVQTHVIDPLAAKYAGQRATAKTVMNALYFLTERCHVRWDKA